MSRRTVQTQRKVKIPSGLKKRLEKAKLEKTVESPVIEIHISNTFSREEFRHKSFISPVVKGIVAGFGLDSYRLGVESIKALKDV